MMHQRQRILIHNLQSHILRDEERRGRRRRSVRLGRFQTGQVAGCAGIRLVRASTCTTHTTAGTQHARL